jgi:hypothetical protein
MKLNVNKNEADSQATRVQHALFVLSGKRRGKQLEMQTTMY